MNPLEADSADEGAPSDHRTSFVTAALPKVQAFTWLKYSYRYYSEEAVAQFRSWIVMEDWSDVLGAEGSNCKADAYQRKINSAIESFFPLITVRRKSTDPPWINARVRKMVKRRKAVFKLHGRSRAWKRLKKKKTLDLISERRLNYEKSQKICLLADDGERNFFKNCKNLSLIHI